MATTDLATKKGGAYEVLAGKLDEEILSVLGSDCLIGFDKAFKTANAISFLKKELTDEAMKPIMDLQGSRLGFKTDKDIDPRTKQKGTGYPLHIVKDCLIDAVLIGLQPYGNQFNIIGGNMYITKEGFTYLLANRIKGLTYSITHELPRINAEKGSAAIVMSIKWTINGEAHEEKIDFPIKVNSFMGADAVIGKANRKARAWLFNQLSGVEVSDGDVEDIEFIEVPTSTEQKKENIRAKQSVQATIDLP